MKRILGFGLTLSLIIGAFSGCGNTSDGITIISREEGSGTRSAFVELFGIEEKDINGNKIDNTAALAEITSSTSVMMMTIAGNKSAIGYISLGSLNDTIKTVEIDGAAPSAENVKNGTYKISRPFNIATKEGISDTATDFITFIMSEQGQSVVEDKGYISQGNNGAYTASNVSGKITVAGSTSVSPVMEALKESYIELNPNVKIEIQQSDSTTGMSSALEGICDIGMASRGLKDSELEKGLTSTVIATDGIAIIINKENVVSSLTKEEVKAIFTATTKNWSEISSR